MGIKDDWGDTQTSALLRSALIPTILQLPQNQIYQKDEKTLPFQDWFPVAGRVLRSGSCGRRCPTLVSDHSNPSSPFCHPLRAQGPSADTKKKKKKRMNFKNIQ